MDAPVPGLQDDTDEKSWRDCSVSGLQEICVEMIIEINSDSEVWIKVKHALREAGYRYYFQQNLFDAKHVDMFLEQRPEPEGGELSHGLIVYPGGCQVGAVTTTMTTADWLRSCEANGIKVSAVPPIPESPEGVA